MDEELREKIYEMHGTVNRLEQKTENMLKQQGRLDGEIDQLEEDIEDVQSTAKRNQKRIYGAFLLTSAGGTVMLAVATYAAGFFP